MSEIDLVEVLNLDKSMSVGEVETILDSLSKETYFRFLFEELPKLLKKKDYEEINERYKTSDDIDELMDELDLSKETLKRLSIYRDGQQKFRDELLNKS